MCVDVPDVGGGELGLPQRPAHRSGLGLPGRVRLDHVVRVGGDAGPGQLAVDPGAAGLRVLEGLDHQHGRALAEYEAVPVHVPRTRRALRLVVAATHRLHLREAGDGQRVDDPFGTADHHDVGPSEADHVDAESDRLVTGGAGRHRGVHARLGPDPEADVGGSGVGHQHRDGQRTDAAGALLLLDVPVAQQGVQTADPGGDGHAEPFPVDRIVFLEAEAGVAPRLHGSDHAELGRAVQPAGLDPLQHLGRIDGGARGDPHRQIVGPGLLDLAHTGTAREQALPGAGDVAAEGSGGSQTGDDDGGLTHGQTSPGSCSGSRGSIRKRRARCRPRRRRRS